MPLNSVQGVLDHLGITKLGDINSPSSFAYDYLIDFTTAIAAGGSVEKTVTVDNESIFVVSNLFLLPFHTADEEGAVKGEGPGWIEVQTLDNTAATDRGMSLSHFRLDIRGGAVAWSSDPIPAAAICSIPGGQIVPLHQRVVAPGSTIKAKLYNDSDNVAPKARLVLMGTRIKRS